MARKKGSKTHCSNCGGEGHTKRTCPDKTHTREPKLKKQIFRRCICSYCGQFGHSRRTCEKLQNDKVELAKNITKYRSKLYDQLVREGYGIGAIIKKNVKVFNHSKLDEDGYATREVQERLFLVVGYNWENALPDADKATAINFRSDYPCYYNKYINYFCRRSAFFKCFLIGKPLHCSRYSASRKEKRQQNLGVPLLCDDVNRYYTLSSQDAKLYLESYDVSKPSKDWFDVNDGSIDSVFKK